MKPGAAQTCPTGLTFPLEYFSCFCHVTTCMPSCF